MVEPEISKPSSLFKPLLTAGIIIIAFGIICIWIGSTINLREEGDGFKIVGWRFLTGGLVSITFAYIARHFVFISAYIKYISKQIQYKRNPKENKFDDWYKP